MELVEGETLADLVRRGPLAPAQVASLGGQLAASLQAIHDAGVIHRDIKPANVLVCASDDDEALRTKLTDFGIARLVDGTRLTSTGLLVGTAAVPQPRADHRRRRVLPLRRLRPRAGAAGVPDRSTGLPRRGDRDRPRAPQPSARDPARARPPLGGRAGGDDRARAGAAADRGRGGVPALGPVRTRIRGAGGRLRPARGAGCCHGAGCCRGRGCGCGCGRFGAQRSPHRGGLGRPRGRARRADDAVRRGACRSAQRQRSPPRSRSRPAGPAVLPRASRPPGRPAPHRPGPPSAAHGHTADPASVSSPGRGARSARTSSRHGGTTSAPDPAPTSPTATPTGQQPSTTSATVPGSTSAPATTTDSSDGATAPVESPPGTPGPDRTSDGAPPTGRPGAGRRHRHRRRDADAGAPAHADGTALPDGWPAGERRQAGQA